MVGWGGGPGMSDIWKANRGDYFKEDWSTVLVLLKGQIRRGIGNSWI